VGMFVPISKSDESPVKIYVSVYFTFSPVSNNPRSAAPYCRCRTPLQFEGSTNSAMIQVDPGHFENAPHSL
jgi:hypothetical protein